MNYNLPIKYIGANNYDYIVSLGNKCATTLVLRELNVYNESFPFDYISLPPCLILKYLNDSTRFYPLRNNIGNNDNVRFVHFNVNDKYDETIVTFKRRFQRLFNILINKKKILFIYSSEADIYNEKGNKYRDNYNELIKIRDFIKAKYNYNKFTIAAVHTNKLYEDIDNIINYTINVDKKYLSDNPYNQTVAVSNYYRSVLARLLNNILKTPLQKCLRDSCNYLKHTNKMNNGGTHCCNLCKTKGTHGPACIKLLKIK